MSELARIEMVLPDAAPPVLQTIIEAAAPALVVPSVVNIPGLIGPIGLTGPPGLTGARGAAGPAPTGTGIVSVIDGVVGTPVPLPDLVAGDAINLRGSLGLGNAAIKDVGHESGMVAAGDDPRFGLIQALGNASLRDVGLLPGNVAAADDPRIVAGGTAVQPGTITLSGLGGITPTAGDLRWDPLNAAATALGAAKEWVRGSTLGAILPTSVSSSGPVAATDVIVRNAKTITRTGNLVSQVVIAGGRTLNFARNSAGFVTSMTDGTNTWTYIRDANNRVTSTTLA